MALTGGTLTFRLQRDAGGHDRRFLIGRDDDSLSLCERAFRERLRQGDPEGAALDGFWLVFGLITRGDWALAGGWIARARADIDDGRRDCAVRGHRLGLPPRPRLSSWADLPMRPVRGMRALPDVRAGAAV
jgi:hypothetical protein